MNKRFLWQGILVVGVLALLAGAIVLSGNVFARGVLASPAEDTAMATASCTPVAVGVFENRIHVRCSAAVVIGTDTIYYWAYPTSDSAGASRFLSLFETARATNQTLTLFYTADDLSGQSFGCINSDCRRLWGAVSP